MARRVFFSFHYDNDVFRVQQVRNMGVIDGNQPISPSEWEDVKRKGEVSIQRWIDDNIKNCECVIVLIGSETANRPWVIHEIKRAWELDKGLFGVHIHNLKDARTGQKSRMGENPFDKLTFNNGEKLSTKVKRYDLNSNDAYNDLRNNLQQMVEIAIKERK